MTLHAGDRPASLVPQEDFPTNLGGLCIKGWTATDLLDSPERLLTPLVRDRRSGPLRPASWEEALDRIVAAITGSQDRYGPDSVGCFGGGGLTNEKAYALGKFARVALRSSAIDYNGRFCMSSAAGASMRTLGLDRGLPFPLQDIAEAEVVLLVGSNPAETMPRRCSGSISAGRAAGATSSSTLGPPLRLAARVCTATGPGTDIALANGLLHIALREGYVDQDYIRRRTTGFEEVRRTVGSYWPDRVERVTGVPVYQLREAVQLLGTAQSAMVLTARGPEQQRTGTAAAQAYLNLALALGLPGKPFSGYGTITGPGQRAGWPRARAQGRPAARLPQARRSRRARPRRCGLGYRP